MEPLGKTRHSLLKLQLYDIPMTEVRQLVYDADRLFYLGRKDQARDNVNNGKKILLRRVDTLGIPANKSMDEIIEDFEKLEQAFDHSPEKIDDILKTLGERINLLLLKGDLVVAGTVFVGEKVP